MIVTALGYLTAALVVAVFVALIGWAFSGGDADEGLRQ